MDKCTLQIKRQGSVTEYTIEEDVCNVIIDLLTNDQLAGIIVDLISHTKDAILPLLEEANLDSIYNDGWDEDDDDDDFE